MATNELLYWYELNVQDVLGCIGGVQALFPILETVAQRECINLLSTMENPSSPATVEKPEMDGWEVLPSSSYAGLSIIRSGFFSLSEYQFSLLINFLILLLIMVLKPYSLQLMIMIHRLLFYFRNESCIECYVYRRKFNYSDCLLNLESALQLFFWNVDWKLEQNPVSGFLSLLRNVLHRHPRNTEQLLEGSNIAIIGSLMQKVTIHSYTVMLNISTITSFWLW